MESSDLTRALPYEIVGLILGYVPEYGFGVNQEFHKKATTYSYYTDCQHIAYIGTSLGIPKNVNKYAFAVVFLRHYATYMKVELYTVPDEADYPVIQEIREWLLSDITNRIFDLDGVVDCPLLFIPEHLLGDYEAISHMIGVTPNAMRPITSIYASFIFGFITREAAINAIKTYISQRPGEAKKLKIFMIQNFNQFRITEFASCVIS